MKKVGKLSLLLFSLLLSLIYQPSKTLINEGDNSKEIIFEGAYDGYSVEKFIVETKQSPKESVTITFFVSESKELEEMIAIRPDSRADMETAQQILKDHRLKTQELVYQNNLKVSSKLSRLFDSKQLLVSQVTPTVQIEVLKESLDQNKISQLNSILNTQEAISEIYVSSTILSREIEPQLEAVLPLINVDTMVKSGQYTGKDIKVGIIESTGINGPQGAVLNVGAYQGTTSTNNDYYGRNITIRPGETATYYHADHVAMIAAGNNGIARGSDILSCYSGTGAESYITWLLSQGMNVSNASFGGIEHSGTYYSYSKIIDSLIKNYFFTFVAAAGNKTASNENYVTWPATALNAIAVGNSYASANILGSTSCYREKDGYQASKPNIVAPGNTVTNSSTGTGTSYSAPEVTGCIALLMEEFPYLVAYPELCLSIITSSASPMSNSYNSNSGENVFDSSGLHNQIGAGLLNYEKMREAARNYLSISRNKHSAIEVLPQSLKFEAKAQQRLRSSLAWLASGTDSNNFTNYDLYLSRQNPDGSQSVLKYINGTTNNVEFLDYTFATEGTFVLSIMQKEVNSKNDYLGLSYVLLDNMIGGSKSGGHELLDVVPSYQEINAQDYGYPEQYDFDPIAKRITLKNGFTFTTNRLRTGVIDGYLTMSAKRSGAGTAYHEYILDQTINQIEYQLALWSPNEFEDEDVTIELELRYANNSFWNLVRVFLPSEMGQNKETLKDYKLTSITPITAFRFIVITSQTDHENNRGRVTIGDLRVQ